MRIALKKKKEQTMPLNWLKVKSIFTNTVHKVNQHTITDWNISNHKL